MPFLSIIVATSHLNLKSKEIREMDKSYSTWPYSALQ